MEEDNFGFKFNIGDDVALSAAVREVGALMKDGAGDKFHQYGFQRLTVIERLLQECYGGVQRHYKVRITAASPERLGANVVGFSAEQANTGLFTLTEPELEAYPVTDATK